jgi:hypothetical protein
MKQNESLQNRKKIVQEDSEESSDNLSEIMILNDFQSNKSRFVKRKRKSGGRKKKNPRPKR